jgi:hypothetical protein
MNAAECFRDGYGEWLLSVLEMDVENECRMF